MDFVNKIARQTSCPTDPAPASYNEDLSKAIMDSADLAGQALVTLRKERDEANMKIIDLHKKHTEEMEIQRLAFVKENAALVEEVQQSKKVVEKERDLLEEKVEKLNLELAALYKLENGTGLSVEGYHLKHDNNRLAMIAEQQNTAIRELSTKLKTCSDDLTRFKSRFEKELSTKTNIALDALRLETFQANKQHQTAVEQKRREKETHAAKAAMAEKKKVDDLFAALRTEIDTYKAQLTEMNCNYATLADKFQQLGIENLKMANEILNLRFKVERANEDVMFLCQRPCETLREVSRNVVKQEKKPDSSSEKADLISHNQKKRKIKKEEDDQQ